MARPKEFDRAKALLAGMGAFWRQGFAATTTEDLVKAMGIGRQSFYDTFGDKRACYLEALRAYAHAEVGAQIDMLHNLDSPLDTLRNLLRRGAGESDERCTLGCMSVNAFAEFGTGDAEVVSALEPSARRLREAVGRLVRAAKDRGELPPSLDEAQAASAIMCTRAGLMLSAKAGWSRDALHQVIDFTIDRLKAGTTRFTLRPRERSRRHQAPIAQPMTHTALTPATLGGLKLTNHIVMAPMTRSRAVGNVPNAMMAEYYAQRATAGLIVTEGTAPAAEGLGYARIPGLFTKEHVAGWRLVTDAVHAKGGHIFVQLMHTGRIFHTLNLPAGVEGVAPSAIAAAGNMWTDQQQMQPNGTPHQLGRDELERVRDEFVESARLAIDAGFDGIELHGANGYLLEQFLNPVSNQRTDDYGGSVENRARFVIEVARAVAAAIGSERTGVRLSPWNVNGDMHHYPETDETYGHLAAELQRLGLVYLHVIQQKSSTASELSAGTLRSIRATFTNTLIVNGGFRTLAAIDEVLDRGGADLVAIGAPFVSNPDLIARLEAGTPFTAPDPATFFAPGAGGFADGYTTYPRAA